MHKGVYEWRTCGLCWGDLPVIDGDNAHCDLPSSPTGGECPGAMAFDGACGAYDGLDLSSFAARAREDELKRWAREDELKLKRRARPLPR